MTAAPLALSRRKGRRGSDGGTPPVAPAKAGAQGNGPSVALVAGITAAFRQRGAYIGGSFLILLLSGFGAFVAARQSWLQWNPPEVASCGRDFYGMIETFPQRRAIPMIFKGSGDCSKVDWTFLGGSIANWSFLVFIGLAVIAIVLMARQFQPRRGGMQFA
jgi:disulfide bond formation protein DsbB